MYEEDTTSSPPPPPPSPTHQSTGYQQSPPGGPPYGQGWQEEKPKKSGVPVGVIIGVCVGGGVLLLLVILGMAILLPALGAARQTARKMENSTHARGIVSSMSIYAAEQGGYHYPGSVDAPMSTLDRFRVLCATTPLEPKTLANPIGSEPYAGAPIDESNADQLQSNHIDYALLNSRSEYYRDDVNSMVPLVADREVNRGSWWTNGEPHWEGHIGWGDAAVSYWKKDDGPLETAMDPDDDIWVGGVDDMENP